MGNEGNAGARVHLFSHSFAIHSFPQATLIEDLLSAGLHCKHWHPAMSKTDKTPDPKELYLRGRSTRGREDGGNAEKQISK